MHWPALRFGGLRKRLFKDDSFLVPFVLTERSFNALCRRVPGYSLDRSKWPAMPSAEL